MRLIAGLVVGLVVGGVAWGQGMGSASGRRPMTFEDLQRMKRVSDPQVSPGGGWVMFSVVDVDLEKNSKVSHLWVVPLDGKGPERQVTLWKEGETGGRFSPDGKQVLFVSADEAGSSQIFLAPWDEAAGRMGTPKRLTNVSTEADGAVWSPDSQRILFVSRVYPECSDEESWLHENECNKRKDEAAAKSPVKAMVFDKLLYRHWNGYVGPKRSHVLVVSATDGNAVRDLTPRREIGDAEAPTFSLGGPVGYAWAPDSKEIAYVTNLDLVPAASTNNDVFTLRLDEAGARPVRISTSPGSDDGPAYSPDGKWLAFRSQARAGYESDRFRLMLFDRAAKTIRDLTPKVRTPKGQSFDGWIDEFIWAPDSSSFLFTSAIRGEEAVFSLDLCEICPQTKSQALFVRRTDVGEFGDLRAFNDKTNHGFTTLVASKVTVTHPTEITSVSLGLLGHEFEDVLYSKGLEPDITPDFGGERVLTHLNDGLLQAIDMQKVESYWFTGAEGAKVQGFIIKPPHFDPAKKYPLKFLIHGGPQGAWGDAWSYRWNPELMAASGYVVVMVNPRGSTGYGQAFIDGVNGDWGGKAYVDLMKGLDAAEVAYPFIDKTRECALGASYGGFMANWILTHTDRFACIVTHDGMFNPQSAYGSTEELWFNEWEFRESAAAGAKSRRGEASGPGQPWNYFDRPAAEDPFRKWSPMLSIRSARTPTLVVHSQKDYRLDVSEGFQLFTALQRLNVPSRMLYFPDEGHWVLKPQNSRLWYQEVGDWCDRWTRTNRYALEAPGVVASRPDVVKAEDGRRPRARMQDQPQPIEKAQSPAKSKAAPAVNEAAATTPSVTQPLARPQELPRAAATVQDRQQTGAGKASFSITISGPESDVRVGSAVQLKIIMKNISDHQLLFRHAAGKSRPEFVYKFEVRGADGRLVEARGTGEATRQQESGPIVDYLQPGGSMVQTANLAKLVKLSRRGRYTVQVSRKDSKNNVVVRSNEVTLNIVP